MLGGLLNGTLIDSKHCNAKYFIKNKDYFQKTRTLEHENNIKCYLLWSKITITCISRKWNEIKITKGMRLHVNFPLVTLIRFVWLNAPSHMI